MRVRQRGQDRPAEQQGDEEFEERHGGSLARFAPFQVARNGDGRPRRGLDTGARRLDRARPTG